LFLQYHVIEFILDKKKKNKSRKRWMTNALGKDGYFIKKKKRKARKEEEESMIL
jgi:hypothetical protein